MQEIATYIKPVSRPCYDSSLTLNSKLTKNWPSCLQIASVENPRLWLSSTTSSISKVVLVGDSGIGKTSIIKKYQNGTISADHKATIGVDFEVLKYQVLSIPFSMQVWDTAGQERFKSMSTQYYRQAKIVVICHQADNGNYDDVFKWHQHVQNSIETRHYLKFLVFTKIDLVEEENIEKVLRAGVEKAKAIGAEFWYCSSLYDKNIKNLFERLACLAFIRIYNEEVVKSQNFEEIKLNSGRQVIRVSTLDENSSLKSCCF